MIMQTEELVKNSIKVTEPPQNGVTRAFWHNAAQTAINEPVEMQRTDMCKLLIKPKSRIQQGALASATAETLSAVETPVAVEEITAVEQMKLSATSGFSKVQDRSKRPRCAKFTVSSGARYGFLTAIEPTEGRRNGYTLWRCRCDCGREYLVASRELKNKSLPSCKDPSCEYYGEALRNSHHAEDFTGRRYGKLVVLGPVIVEKDAPAASVDFASSTGLVAPAPSTEATAASTSTAVPGCLGGQEQPEQLKLRGGFGGLASATQVVKHNSQGHILWNCKCDCGNSVEATGAELKTGNRKSCGCLSRPPLKDWIGHRFGKLTVTAYDGKRKGAHFWRCICDCENETVVCQSSLKSGHTTSCGCQARPISESRTFIDGTCIEILRSALMKGTISKNNSSGVRGVYWDKKHERWIAQITFKGKTIHLGGFKSIEEARAARKQAEERYFGEFLEAYDRQTAVVATGVDSSTHFLKRR